MNEKTAYAAFRENIIGRGDRIDRVENPIVPGMPDVSCCLRPGVEFWMEIKAPREPIRDSTPLFGSRHGVMQSQANWIRSQIQAGGKCYFFIETDLHRFMIDGGFCDEINELTVHQIKVASFWWVPKPTPGHLWIQLKEILCKR